jgi:hypothetical protein
LLTRDEKTARELAGGQQDRSHADMGNMLELFDKYDAESRTRKKLLPGAPRPEWLPQREELKNESRNS